MRYILVDAENVGINCLKKLALYEEDEIVIFSNNESIIATSQEYEYTIVKGYPCYKDAADFCIIFYLGKIIECIKNSSITAKVELISNDKKLIKLFVHLCHRENIEARATMTKLDLYFNMDMSNAYYLDCSQMNAVKEYQSAEGKLLQYLSNPNRLDYNAMDTLGLSQSDFTRAVTNLIKDNKIQRTETRKLWLRC